MSCSHLEFSVFVAAVWGLYFLVVDVPLSDPIQLLEAPEADVGRSEIVDLILWVLAVLPKYSMF